MVLEITSNNKNTVLALLPLAGSERLESFLVSVEI